jgi:hypothetical protein
MLDNDKLNRRLKKILKELKEKWRITPYRVAVETGIPHSSLKYMVDGKFEWKLNHLLAIVDFLNKYGAKTSITELLDFENKKSLTQIMNMKDADFRRIKIKDKSFLKKAAFKNLDNLDKTKAGKSKDAKTEAEELSMEIADVVKDNRLFKSNKIVIGLKVNGKNFNFQKNLSFSNGKQKK